MEEAAERWVDSIMAQIDSEVLLLSEFEGGEHVEPNSTHPPAAPPSRFTEPTSNEEVLAIRESCVPKTTSRSTQWALTLWKEWSSNRREMGADYPPCIPNLLSEEGLDTWLSRFVMEVRRKDGNEYPPNTLYQICCGIMRHMRSGNPSINFFTQVQFNGFKKTLDGRMRQLKAKGVGATVKRAQPITHDHEDILWQKGLLGASNPQTLLDTMIYMCGIYFALRSGQEHRHLQFSQINLTEKNGQKCLVYAENCSKNNPGGLKNRKLEPKTVTHYENTENPSRCFVKMYQMYAHHCPPAVERKSDAFYLTPLKKPKDTTWFSAVPVGHNTLSKTIHRICNSAGIDAGFISNHSLRVTAATRLFQAGVDEQLIMKRTGHRSIDGVRLYKRISNDQEQAVSSILNSASAPSTSSSTDSYSSDIPQIPVKRPKLSETEQLPFALNITNSHNIQIQIYNK